MIINLSKKLNILVILPARLGSTRLTRKPLLMLAGKPLIAHTYERVLKIFSDVIVATDSNEIGLVCKSLDIPYVITSHKHENGTLRTLEAYQLLGKEYDYIINVQGDEAFITGDVLAPLTRLLEQERPMAATLKAPVPEYDSNSNVFVTTNLKNQALYFSRSPIPNSREGQVQRFQHVGVYAFTPEALQTYCSLTPTPLEQEEMLEQLRWMEHGYAWSVATAPIKPLSIDTAEDFERAKSFIK